MTLRTRDIRVAPWRQLFTAGVVSATFLAMVCFGRGSTVWQRRDGPFLSRAVLWDATDFTESNLRSFYGKLARQMKGNRGWDVGVFVDRGDLTRETYGKLATEKEYDWWQDLYDKFGHRMLPMAEFFGYKDNAVLRMRDGAGTCSEITLAGRDFLRESVDGSEFEILKIDYHPLPPLTKPSPDDEAMVTIYARASRFPTVTQAREFSRTMQQRLREKRVIVTIRTDSYFLTDVGFPILYRFDEKPTPPSREQYDRSKTMYCFTERPGILCR
jgi:hypothetical protein